MSVINFVAHQLVLRPSEKNLEGMYRHVITVINRENKKGVIKDYYHVLYGVHYQDKQGVKTGSTEHFTNNQGYVQIPHKLEGYMNPDEWINSNQKEKFWTIRENDFILKGIPDRTNPDNSYNIRTIDSWENIDYGLIIPGHYGVTLK